VRASRAPVPSGDAQAALGRTLFSTTGLVVPSFSCATCHGGVKWTRSTVDYPAPPSAAVGLGLGNESVIGAELRQTATQPNTPGPVPAPQFPGVLVNVGTFTLGGGRTNEIRFNGADIGQAISPLGANGFNIPSLLSVAETAPYFYSGLAQTLEQVLDGSQDGNGGTRHHFVANAGDRAALVAFLRSIDDTTAPVAVVVGPPPAVASSVGRSALWPATRGLTDVQLSVTATPGGDPNPTRRVAVFSDEPNGAAPYAPDAVVSTTPPLPPGQTFSLRLRAEREVTQNGRVYVISTSVTDASGRVARDCVTVICPVNLTTGHLAALLLDASNAEASCEASPTGTPSAPWNHVILPPTALP
jgi:hypothetical protein